MCIAIPMRVLEVRNDTDVVVTRPGRTELADAGLDVRRGSDAHRRDHAGRRGLLRHHRKFG